MVKQDSNLKFLFLLVHLIILYKCRRKPADGTNSGYVRVNTDKLLVAAIEVGNACSNHAFSYRVDHLKIKSNMDWSTPWGISRNNRSVVLFDENKTFHSFGFDAEERYAELVDGREHHRWYFFKNFMMKLSGRYITRNIEIEDDKKRKMKAIDVIGAVIKYLKDHLINLLKKELFSVQDKDIHWVLTVPAIWTDSAKQLMGDAAYKADIAESQLTIVTEPEAAIVYYQTENPIWNLTTANISSPGTNKCMVIDIGGSTTDFTILERQSDGGLSEIKSATGIACGENMVIEEFHELLRYITGDAVYQKWIDEYAVHQTDLQNEIVIKTRTLKANSTGKETFKVPFSLPNIFKEINHESTLQAIERSQYKGRITWSSDKIRLDAEIVKHLFKPCTDSIVDHVKHLLKAPEVQGTSIFLMVGGFSKFSIVQEAIIKAFPTVNVIIPEEPSTVVLKGAVIYGHQH
ncbi:heat shock 70 kDa protein 12B-like [Ruditapes philippinarum]|uniref:heat shock 70 kDa protein 12B-like n=1 Tax=Ruditapes philippinarum TaxID=129788 RepID=UPI00295BB2C5|nr:heat shock 70 kDa protein 12B-like [Ruditapes philippinarum]